MPSLGHWVDDGTAHQERDQKIKKRGTVGQRDTQGEGQVCSVDFEFEAFAGCTGDVQ